jgi:hypothetical protein
LPPPPADAPRHPAAAACAASAAAAASASAAAAARRAGDREHSESWIHCASYRPLAVLSATDATPNDKSATIAPAYSAGVRGTHPRHKSTSGIRWWNHMVIGGKALGWPPHRERMIGLLPEEEEEAEEEEAAHMASNAPH